jgi:hypothetical protein
MLLLSLYRAELAESLSPLYVMADPRHWLTAAFVLLLVFVSLPLDVYETTQTYGI